MAYHRLGNDIPPEHWRALRAVVDTAAQQWREPDANIWEMRGPPRHFTHSKVLNWVALDRGIALAESLGDADAPVDRWRAERDVVHADVLAHGWDEDRGAFVQQYGEPPLDASLLRLSLLGFLPGDDRRVVATIDRIADELGDGPALVHRYDTDEVDDGLDGGEGAFLLCSFEMVGALVLAGRAEEARARFDWLVDRAGPLGLYSEEMAPRRAGARQLSAGIHPPGVDRGRGALAVGRRTREAAGVGRAECRGVRSDLVSRREEKA